uniref:Uncharacterized protein n=1 Tax=Chromera velia CCMP2878 TaxID=1169474 RepID=A0A0G4F0J8_9ALVE|eukprot:Cvel_14527.t1-p1 / transcript=Cvel_14527.t1 / gene=Cvel_14527 / organism=Chromera_velia_CCMP2878 / gene_product=hypothetical protein / transcript_product=hypothetical protein / location=Cvel_scaffold1037:31694-33589(-) / protein_length=411 / sequence_SO=supercontig / SO=protein_coding / is_pseudo=false
MVDQQREVMALHACYGHQNFNNLKETLAAEGIDIDEDCRRSPGLHPIEYRQGPSYIGKGLQALVERCIRSNREGVALLISDPNHRFPLAVIHLMAMGERWGYSCAFHRTVGGIPFTLTFRRAPPGWKVHPEHLQTVPDNLRLWGGHRFDQNGNILLAPTRGDQDDLRLWKTSARQEGGTGARYRRRAGRSDLGHRGFPLVLPGTSPEISSTEAQASASSSSFSALPSSSALPSALPPSFPPPAPVEPSNPSPAQAEASVREAGAAGAQARSPSPAMSNRASVDSGESPLPDFIVPLGSLMKGTILDPSGPGVLRMPGTVRQHNRALSRGRRVMDLGPVFCDEKGNRLLGANGEPLGYNWKVEWPVFMTYHRGVYDAWTRRFALMFHPDLGEITQGEVLDTLNFLRTTWHPD